MLSDSQLLLGITQCINFDLTRKCTTSRYHYEVGSYLVLLACYSSLLSITFLRNFVKAPLTAFIRLVSLVALIVLVSYVTFISRRYDRTDCGVASAAIAEQ